MSNGEKQLAAQNNRYLRALLQLVATQPDKSLRPELILADAGLEYQDIAEILKKKPDAVRMMVVRHRKAARAAKHE